MAGRLTAEDRLDIQELLHRYAWTLDTADADGFVACFTPDAELVWDTFETPDRWQGAERLRTFAGFFASRPGAAGRQHHIQNVLIEADGEEARVSAYCIVTDHKGEPPYPVVFTGHYADRVVRTAEGWRLAEHWIRDWSGAVLARFAGQTGERVPRRRPPELSGA